MLVKQGFLSKYFLTNDSGLLYEVHQLYPITLFLTKKTKEYLLMFEVN